MATVYECDRCHGQDRSKYNFTTITLDVDGDKTERELCTRCYRELNTFLAMNPTIEPQVAVAVPAVVDPDDIPF